MTDLLEKGAPTDATDSEGSTPLHVASTLDKPEMVRSLLLLANSSDDNQAAAAATSVMMSALTCEGVSPLYIAASKGYVEVLRLVI